MILLLSRLSRLALALNLGDYIMAFFTGYFSKKKFNNGFTVLEIICVLIILGILVAVAIAKFDDLGIQDISISKKIKTHLRYAQLKAMGDIYPWGIKFEGSKYTLQKNWSNSTIKLPGENNPYVEDLPVSISSTTNIVAFSSGRGQPVDTNGNLLTNDVVITIGSEKVYIKPQTGFIP